MEKGRFRFRENEDKSINISYEDYNVECFGGGSYEANYSLDTENRKKLETLLSEFCSGNLEEMITEMFGECLDRRSFDDYCRENGIEFGLFTWISD